MIDASDSSKSEDNTTAEMSDGPISNLVRSRQRVANHGEVFTPGWLVEDMLNLVSEESERVDARFLEPACGSGNFLVPVLRRKPIIHGDDDCTRTVRQPPTQWIVRV